MNGSASAFHPDSMAPTQRFEPGIVFGGSIVSDQSSPVLPPSASSTNHNYQTPVSDTTSAPSRPFHDGFPHAHHPSHNNFGPAKPIQPSPSLAANNLPLLPPQPRLDHHYVQSLPQPPPVNPDGMPLHGPSEAQALLAYLVTQFNNPEFADCTLDISAKGHSVNLSLHSVVVARSPRIRSLLVAQTHRDGSNGRTHIVLEPSDAFVSIPAIVSALRVCYGTSASASHFSSAFPAPPEADERGYLSMDMCLAYLAAGHLLQLNEVATVGLNSAYSILTVDKLETYLAFGLAGSLEAFESNETELQDGQCLKRSTFAPYSDEVVGTAIHFILSRLHPGFELDVNAPASEKLGGIPNFKDSSDIGHRRLSSNPKLSFIQFGEMQAPVEPDTTILSTLLLSLPFDILRHMLRTTGLPDLTRVVVDERERRRVEYLKRFESQGSGYGGVSKKKARASWQENVDASGIALIRRLVQVE
jgi:hypothetical protein